MIRNITGKRIESHQKDLVLREMIDQCLAETSDDFRDDVFAECIGRESAATTVFEKGLAFPHAKMATKMEPTICVGYCREGIVWDSAGEVVHIIVLSICHKDDHLPALAELASIMQVPGVQEKIGGVDSPEAIIQILENARTYRSHRIPSDKTNLTHAIIEHISMQVGALDCYRVFLFTNKPGRLTRIMKAMTNTRMSLVTNKGDLSRQVTSFENRIDEIYQVAGNLHNEKAILMELWTQEKLKDGVIVICISGFEYDDTPHKISVHSVPWDLYNESRILNYQVPQGIDLEVLSRVVYLAMELAREGREGKPVGTLFILGNYDEVKPYCKQLIINPFGGLDKQSRSILDPSLSETIKEYSKIDGAFIIGQDGLILSAGTYLSIPPNKMELAPGLGARHAAAMGITLVAPVVSVVISESTQNIRLFWDGAEQDLYTSSP